MKNAQHKPINPTLTMWHNRIPKRLLWMASFVFSFSLLFGIYYLIINTHPEVEMVQLEVSPSRAIVYPASSETDSRFMNITLSQLCSVFSNHSYNYDLVFVRFPWEPPTSVFPSTCNNTFRNVVHIAIDPTEVGSTIKNEFAKIEDGRKYRLMIWFWLRAIYTHEALTQYKYILRLDSDSIFLSPIKKDPVDIVASSNALIGYHCFTYENPLFVNGIQSIAYSYVKQRNSTYPNFAYPRDAFPMFYTNFLVLDRSKLSLKGKTLTTLLTTSLLVSSQTDGAMRLFGDSL